MQESFFWRAGIPTHYSGSRPLRGLPPGGDGGVGVGPGPWIIYIYIYIMLPIFLGGPMGPIHPAWGHVSLASASSFLEVFAYSDTRQDADLHLEVQEHSSAVPHANARQAPLQ